MRQLDSVYDSTAVLEELRGATKILDRSQGSRSRQPQAFLRRLERALSRAGIIRVGNISFLAASSLPVFQTTRPAMIGHSLLGQNSGSQGRGTRAVFAQLSAIMETMEMHCAEPRNAQLVRGCQAFLRRTQAILPLAAYHAMLNGVEPPDDHEPLMWTSALSVEKECDLLAPAEALFYALNARDYDTRPIFPASSNGLGGGASLIEACLHGLYELLERYFFACCQLGDPRLVQDRIRQADLAHLPGYTTLRTEHPETEIGVFALRFEQAPRSVAMAVSVLSDPDGKVYWGSACHHEAKTTLLRSLAEAAQERATRYSAAREDMAFDRLLPSTRPLPAFQALRSIPARLTLERFERSASGRQFATLQEEFSFVVSQVHRLGFPHVLIKNLTRVGLEVPVVRVLVPGMRMQTQCSTRQWSRKEYIECQYSLEP